MTLSTMTYCNVVGGGPIYGYRQHTQKFGDFGWVVIELGLCEQRDIQTETDRQTLITIHCTPPGEVTNCEMQAIPAHPVVTLSVCLSVCVCHIGVPCKNG